MRFVLGAIPENPDFDPAAGAWNALREPTPARMNLLVLPIAAATLILLLGLFTAFTPMSRGEMLAPFFLCFLAIIPIHEFIHALVTPRFGFSRDTLIGLWPSHLLFYAHYEGEITRTRFLAVLAAPTIVLTVLPTIVLCAVSLDAPVVAAVAIANGAAACGDLFGMGLMLRQVPRGAIVRNKGWRTFWREA